MKLALCFVLCGFLVVATTGQTTLPIVLKNLGTAVANVANTLKSNFATVQQLGGANVVSALKNLEVELGTFSFTLSANAVNLTQVLSSTVTNVQVTSAFNSLTVAFIQLNTDLATAFRIKSGQALINAMRNFYLTATPTITQIMTLLQKTSGTAAYNVRTGLQALLVDVNALGVAVLG
ncbi:uncharacterized protein LOC129748589 [Uranotaenia lowii]|uniref:uncharacterized protein LOC129748589 n=1 Tax=Uranotaenia lowii TaxID=190385 RepID=UPI00247A4AD2|nr:uncharacterized protein LOC129748589 [Uranotaenia lowii]